MFRVFILFLKLTMVPKFIFYFYVLFYLILSNFPKWLRDSCNKNEVNKQMRLIKLALCFALGTRKVTDKKGRSSILLSTCVSFV